MRYDVEMKTNRELGEREGEVRGLKIGEEKEKKKVIRNLYKLNIPIEQIAKAVELTEKKWKR